MDPYESLDLVEQSSKRLIELARPGEQLAAVSSMTVRRRHATVSGRIQSGAQQVETEVLVRLAANGRDFYLANDGLAGAVGERLVGTARALVPSGRVYRDGVPQHAAVRWDADAFVDTGLTDPAATISQLRAEAEKYAREVAERQGVRATVLDCSVAEQWSAEAFASSQGAGGCFGRNWSEVRIEFEVAKGGRSTKIRASRHATRIGDLPVEDLCSETFWQAAARLVGAGDDARGHRDRPDRPDTATDQLLLTPRAFASILRVVVQDQFEQETPRPVVRGELPCSLIDDPHAPHGGHSRPFDHEGSPTGRHTLIDRGGRRATMVSRGTALRSDDGKVRQLTGHAIRPWGAVTPEPLPSNVRVDVRPFVLPADYTGILGHQIRGEGTQGHRSGSRITLRIETAYVRAGEVVSRGEPLILAATAVELLDSVIDASEPLSYFPWRDYSTAGSWVRWRTPVTLAGPTA